MPVSGVAEADSRMMVAKTVVMRQVFSTRSHPSSRCWPSAWEEDAVLVCDRERLLVQGVLIPHSRSTSLLPPNKRARVEVRSSDASVETSKKFTEKETKLRVAAQLRPQLLERELVLRPRMQAAKLVESSAVR